MAAGSPTPDLGRQRLTRDRIVAVALEQVERDGFEALSLRSLAKALGVTAPAIYDHLENKTDVLCAVATIGYQELDRRFDVTDDRAIDRVRARARAYVDFAAERPELFRTMFLYRPAAIEIETDNELSAASGAFENGLEDITEAIADGDMVDRDPVTLSLTIWAAIHGIASVGVMAPPVAEEVGDDVLDAVLAGLRPTS